MRSRPYFPTVDEFVEWVQDRDYYHDQIQFQRAGRAGRGTEPSLVALVASEDQLDQYVIKHPQELFEQTPERAVANPSNPHLLQLHAHAAAVEQPTNGISARRSPTSSAASPRRANCPDGKQPMASNGNEPPADER